MATRLGFIGIGSIAAHHAAAGEFLGAVVAGACAGRPDSPRWHGFLQKHPGCIASKTPEELAAREDIDALVVCPSWDKVCPVAMSVADHGKPMLLEKPIALTAREARALAARVAGSAPALVGYNRRFYEPVQALRDRIKTTRPIGVSVRISETASRHVERQGRAVLEHLLAFSSAHTLDLLTHLLGRPRVVNARRHRHAGALDPFESIVALLETKEGIPVTLEILGDDPGPSEMRFRFDDASCWVLAPLERLTVYQGTDVLEADAESPIRRFVPRPVDMLDADMRSKPGITAQMRAFLTGNLGPGATLGDAIEVMDLIEALKGGRP
jgi:predicted dehydrogenase